ncbi:TPA: flagellar basal body-associated protein FliL [Enterobacter kobei]|nr:flagellar basal body-associated protein FliL [Enterobacter kobei]
MPKTKQKVSGNGKKHSFIFFMMVLIILGLAALAGYAFYQMHIIQSAQQAEINTSSPAKKTVPAPSPIYVPLDAFMVSLKPGENDGDRVLYIGLTLQLKDESSKLLLQQFMPEVRSRLLLLFSKQTGDELATDSGKVELINKIKSAVNLPLANQQSVMVTDVLLNAFILR